VQQRTPLGSFMPAWTTSPPSVLHLSLPGEPQYSIRSPAVEEVVGGGVSVFVGKLVGGEVVGLEVVGLAVVGLAVVGLAVVGLAVGLDVGSDVGIVGLVVGIGRGGT